MIREFQYNFDELFLQPDEIEEFMGFEKGDAPEPFPELIESGLSKANELCEIKGGLRTVSYAVADKTKATLKADGLTFAPGKIVTGRLFHATSAAFFICTAGHQISDYSKKMSSDGDALTGYIFDVIGSLIVEKAMDRMQKWLEIEMATRNLNISDRFSPGYCNWDVAEQQKLFSLFPDGFSGVTLSSSSLMNPIKSVSGIIGIGQKLKQKGYQCNWCNDLNCFYGRIKRSKKASKKTD